MDLYDHPPITLSGSRPVWKITFALSTPSRLDRDRHVPGDWPTTQIRYPYCRRNSDIRSGSYPRARHFKRLISISIVGHQRLSIVVAPWSAYHSAPSMSILMKSTRLSLLSAT